MRVNAQHKNARISAQKARLVADLIRGKDVAQALNILTFSPKKGAELIKKVLESAIANAEQHLLFSANAGLHMGLFFNERAILINLYLSNDDEQSCYPCVCYYECGSL